MRKPLFPRALAAVAVCLVLTTSCLAILGEAILSGLEGTENTENNNSGNSNSGSAVYQTGKLFYSDNPLSKMLVSGMNAAGDMISILGDKLSDGTPTAITNILVTQKGTKDPISYFFDNSNLTKVIAPNGVTMNFDYVSASEVALMLYDPTSGEQLNTVVDPTGSKAPRIQEINTNAPTREGEVTLTVRDAEMPVITVEPDTKGSNIKGKVITTQCEARTFIGNVYVNVHKANDTIETYLNLIERYDASPTSTQGVYEYTIPAGTQPHNVISAKKFIDYVDTYMGYLCTGGGDKFMATCVCPGITMALAATVVGSPAAAAFLTACEVATAGVAVYCATAGDGVPGGTSLIGAINEKMDIKDIEWDTPLYIRACTDGLSGYQYGTRTTYKSGGTAEDLFITSEGTFNISPVKLNPSAPKAHQSYTAEVTLTCMPKGAKATLSVFGTDDYEKEVSYTFEETTNLKVLSMSVPGGAGGVKDVITITVDMPDGSQHFKNASLVFGS